jgi:hypothetical protein
MFADGGECISDIATLADHAVLFGPVASVIRSDGRVRRRRP